MPLGLLVQMVEMVGVDCLATLLRLAYLLDHHRLVSFVVFLLELDLVLRLLKLSKQICRVLVLVG